jgi:hypothetical protein
VTRTALQWAPGFYGAHELDIVVIALRIKPAELEVEIAGLKAQVAALLRDAFVKSR